MLTDPITPQTSPKGPRSRILDRGFQLLERLAWNRTTAVIVLSLLVAGLCLWYTAENLTFKTKRSDLISRDLPYDILYKQYRKEFQDFDGMIIVVEGQDPEAMKGFTHRFVEAMQAHRSSFHKIFYKVDTRFFKSRALMFLDLPDLEDLAEKLREHDTFLGNVNASPGLNTLLANINREISEGMVDTLLGDFLGTDEEDDEDAEDLSLLINIFRQMNAALSGETRFRSPWKSFLTDREDSLKDEGYLVSPNGQLLFILLSPVETENDFTGSKDAIDRIRGVIRDTQAGFPGLQVGLTGSDVISSDEMYTTRNDVERASKIALTGVALLFILAYRGVVHPLLAVFALLVALAWSMGYTTLAVGHLNIISVVFTTILIGLGIDFGIHILERYREERRSGLPVRPALLATLRGTGRGNLAGAITTAIAFGSMAFTDFIGIAELGVIAGGGILLCWLSMVIFLPALICLEDRLRRPRYLPLPTQPVKERRLQRFFAHYPAIIGVSVLVLVWSAWVGRDMKFDYNLLNLQAKGTEAVEWELKIIENAKRATWYVAFISDTLEEARRKYDAVRDLPSVGKVDSIFSALPDHQEEKIRIINALREDLPELKVAERDEPFSLDSVKNTLDHIRFKLRKKETSGKRDDVFEASQWVDRLRAQLAALEPAVAETRLAAFSEWLMRDYRDHIDDLRTSLHPEPVRLEDLPESLRNRFVGRTGKHLILAYPSINIWERPAMEKFLREVRAIDPLVTGNAVHVFESSRLMVNGYVQGGIYAMIAIFFFLMLSLRRLASTLLVLIPTCVGSLWTVGFMDLMNLQFNMANLVILPLIIGIGVVNGVHILHRFREHPAEDNVVLSKSTGQAVVLSSLTTIIGFGSLMTADHMGVYSLGLVLSLGVGSCLIASVTLLPAMIKLGCIRGWRF